MHQKFQGKGSRIYFNMWSESPGAPPGSTILNYNSNLLGRANYKCIWTSFFVSVACFKSETRGRDGVHITASQTRRTRTEDGKMKIF